MSGAGLAFCSIDEAWGGNQKQQPTPEELYNIKTPKVKTTPNKNKQELDRYYENHNGVLKRSSDVVNNGPVGINSNGGMKPMQYGKRDDIGEGSINPFFRDIVEKYKQENEQLKIQIEQLQKELSIYKNSDAQSVSSSGSRITPKPKMQTQKQMR